MKRNLLIKGFVQDEKKFKWKVFILCFIFYSSLGAAIVKYNKFEANMFFGADNYRGYLDMAVIVYSHFRINLHPLFLLLVQPIVRFMMGIIPNDRMAILLVESLFASVTVMMMYLVLDYILKLPLLKKLFTLIYAVSFSTIIFATIPETFIFSSFFLMAFWLYILYLTNLESEIKNEKMVIFVLVILGICNFGITFTNYISYFIGILYLFLNKKGKINKWRLKFAGLNFANLSFGIILNILQKQIWKDSPLFITTLYKAVFEGDTFDEYKWLKFDVSLEKTYIYLKQFLIYPIVSPDIKQVNMGENYNPILFSAMKWPIKLLVFGSCMAVCICIIMLIFFIYRKHRKFGVFLPIAATYLLNIFFHFFYGHDEAFIYSQHYYFLVVIISAIAIEYVISFHITHKYVVYCIIVIYTMIIAGNNFLQYINMIEIVRDFFNNSYSIFLVIAQTCTLCILMFFLIYVALKIIKSYVKIDKKIVSDFTLLYVLTILTYILICTLSCIWIATNYNLLKMTIS